jgi:AcrR family transcriptional regulator
MRSIKSFRPQNQNPEGLIRYSQELAQRNRVAVQAAVQAMQRRRMAPHEITIDAVARESGVSRATIYRCDTLYAMVQKANQKLRRREAEQKIREDHERSQAQVAAAVQEKEHYKKEASFAQLGSQGLQQQIMQMKKKILALQHENARLTELLTYCTCESKHLGVPHPAEG